MLIRKVPTRSTMGRAVVVLFFYGLCSVSLMINLKSNDTYNGLSVRNYESSSGEPTVAQPSSVANIPQNAATSNAAESNASTTTRVSCGGHYATSCEECPGPLGEKDHCNGECDWFQVHNVCAPKGTRVSCGSNHFAAKCSECPGSVGENSCQGDCFWRPDDQLCVPGVSCGNHNAEKCSECPGSVGEDNCKGDCFWHPTDKLCVPKRAVAGAGYETISEADVTYLRDVLATVTQVLHEHRIQYWLDAGTLLGAMRNRPPGLNRWDDDLDIGIKNIDYSKAEKILERDKRLVVKSKVWGGNGYGLATYENYGSISVERFVLDLTGYSLFQQGDSSFTWYSYDRNKNEKIFEDRVAYKRNEIDQTVNCTFWDLEVRCPKHSIAALKRQFGDEVMSRAVAFNHVTDTHLYIEVESDDVNHYLAYLPALNHNLAKKLLPNANLASPNAL